MFRYVIVDTIVRMYTVYARDCRYRHENAYDLCMLLHVISVTIVRMYTVYVSLRM